MPVARVESPSVGEPLPAPPAPGGAAALAWLERAALPLLLLLMAAFALVFTRMALARLDAFRQGFDLVSYVQPIWNTAHGRPFEQSIYAGTDTILGVDLFLIEGLLALPYRLLPGYGTLFGILAAVTALGALAIYLIAREALGSRLAALLAGSLYLFSLTIQSVTPYEFRPRLIAATALLFAFYFAQRQRAAAFWLALLVALSVRLDVALVVAMLGLYGLLRRRPWPFALAPLLVGLGYWLLGLFVVVPALRQGQSFLFLFYFSWLGATPGEMLRTLVTQPLYVLANVLTPAKLLYTLHLLWPVALLALLRPKELLPALPPYAINMLGSERTQFTITYDYSVLIVPWVLLAGVLTAGDIVRGRGPIGRALGRLRAAPARAVVAPLLLGLLLLATLSQHAALGSPLVQYLRGYPPHPRAAAAHQALAALPPEAPVAVSNVLGPHVPMRRGLYFFPGNRAYSPELIDRAAWVLADRGMGATAQTPCPAECAAVERLQGSGAWRTVLDSDGYVLLERRR